MEKVNKIKAIGSWILFVIKYWIVLVILFQLTRLVFLLFNSGEVKVIGLKQALLACWYGLRMDLSMATYVLLPFILLALLTLFIKPFRAAFMFQIYTGLILILILFLLVVDLSMYKGWGFRLDATPLKYISHPREAWASIEHLPLGWITVILIVAGFFLIRLNNLFLKKTMSRIDQSAIKFWVFLSMLLLLGLSILPIRGGWQLAPINQSSVYFSSDNFANQAALNGPWNLMYSLTRSANEKENPFLEVPKQETDSLLNVLFESKESGDKLLDVDSTSSNVIIVIWEGLTAKVIDSVKEGREITPHFNFLKNEGVYFSNLYGSGDRTDKGLVAVLSGYPSNPKESIVKSPVKAAKLPMLSKEFYKRKYHTSFYYGGETEFANMKAYLLQGGFERIISVDDFDKKDLNSKWGAHDEVVMNRVIKDISSVPPPFFCTWLTLSSHEPFEVPSAHIFKNKDEESLYLNSLHYTDSIFGIFIAKLKSSQVWKNTVVLIVADHGSRMPKVDFKADDFRIGALILGGLVKQPRVISRIGGQVDLAGMLMNEFKYKDVVFPWSRNLLDTTSLPWSFFSFNNGFGYAEPLGTFIYDNIGRRIIQQRGRITEQQIKSGKVLQQSIFQDYLDK